MNVLQIMKHRGINFVIVLLLMSPATQIIISVYQTFAICLSLANTGNLNNWDVSSVNT